jgi:ferredoxin
MMANYGYQDGSGEYFITIATEKCNGCGDCARICPAHIFEVVVEDPNDPLREEPVAVVAESMRRKLRYGCSPCKPSGGRPPLPCVEACTAGAISHSW